MIIVVSPQLFNGRKTKLDRRKRGGRDRRGRERAVKMSNHFHLPLSGGGFVGDFGFVSLT